MCHAVDPGPESPIRARRSADFNADGWEPHKPIKHPPCSISMDYWNGVPRYQEGRQLCVPITPVHSSMTRDRVGHQRQVDHEIVFKPHLRQEPQGLSDSASTQPAAGALSITDWPNTTSHPDCLSNRSRYPPTRQRTPTSSRLDDPYLVNDLTGLLTRTLFCLYGHIPPRNLAERQTLSSDVKRSTTSFSCRALGITCNLIAKHSTHRP